MGRFVWNKPELELRILKVFLGCEFMPSSVAHKKLAYDIQMLDWNRVKYLAENCSPSQLGKMGYLGVRRLAQLRRDNPAKFKKVMKELKVICNE